MERWVPGMKRDGRMIGVFPTQYDKGVVVQPEQLLNDLSKECERYG